MTVPDILRLFTGVTSVTILLAPVSFALDLGSSLTQRQQAALIGTAPVDLSEVGRARLTARDKARRIRKYYSSDSCFTTADGILIPFETTQATVQRIRDIDEPSFERCHKSQRRLEKAGILGNGPVETGRECACSLSLVNDISKNLVFQKMLAAKPITKSELLSLYGKIVALLSDGYTVHRAPEFAAFSVALFSTRQGQADPHALFPPELRGAINQAIVTTVAIHKNHDAAPLHETDLCVPLRELLGLRNEFKNTPKPAPGTPPDQLDSNQVINMCVACDPCDSPNEKAI